MQMIPAREELHISAFIALSSLPKECGQAMEVSVTEQIFSKLLKTLGP